MAKKQSQGPHKAEPRYTPPAIDDGIGGARWEQVRNGDWYAFYSNIGPGRDYHVEHPDDPNWWAENEDADPEAEPGSYVWACRHGYYNAPEGESHCRDNGSCGSGPIVITVTDEEVEEAGQKLAALLSSMESK